MEKWRNSGSFRFVINSSCFKAQCKYCKKWFFGNAKWYGYVQHAKSHRQIINMRIKAAKINKALIYFLCNSLTSVDLVESKHFRALTRMGNPDYQLPSKEKVKIMISRNYSAIKQKIQSQLANVKYVSLNTDSWKTLDEENYVSLTVNFLDENTEMQSYLLDTRYFYEEYRTAIEETCDKWNITSKVVCVTSDGSNAAIKEAVESFNWVHIDCLAHIVNSTVEKGLKEIEEIQEIAREITDHYRDHSNFLVELQVSQKESEDKLELDDDHVYGWLSTLLQFKWILKYRNAFESHPEKYLSFLPKNITSDDFEVIKEASELLGYFEELAVDMVQDERLILSEYINRPNFIIEQITEIFQKILLSNSIKNMCQIFLTELKEKFDHYTHHNFIAENMILDPGYKREGVIDQTIFDDSVSRLKEMLSNSTSAEVKEPLEKRSRSDENSLNDGIKELDRYLKEPKLLNDTDPRDWWDKKKHIYPHLYDLVLKRHCATITSIPPDRLFTEFGQEVMQRRRYIDDEEDDTSKMMIFLNQNLRV